MILGKTNHPVEIKQIPLRSWPLRSEIEVALNTCLKEDGTLDEEKAKKIREFFDKISYPSTAEVTALSTAKESEENKESEESNNEAKAESETESESETETDSSASNTEENEGYQNIYRPDQDKIYLGKSLLSDIHMDSIVFFSEKEYTPGQTLTLEIINAKPFCLHLKVDNVMNFSRNSKVITPHKMGYRVLGTFLFPFEDQKTNLRQFLEKIEPEILGIEREKQREKDEKSPDKALDKAEEDSEDETEDSTQGDDAASTETAET